MERAIKYEFMSNSDFIIRHWVDKSWLHNHRKCEFVRKAVSSTSCSYHCRSSFSHQKNAFGKKFISSEISLRSKPYDEIMMFVENENETELQKGSLRVEKKTLTAKLLQASEGKSYKMLLQLSKNLLRLSFLRNRNCYWHFMYAFQWVSAWLIK